MNKRIVNVQAKAFLVWFAVAAILLGAYGVFGTLLLRGDGIITGAWGFSLLLAISLAALGSGLIALLVILNDHVGGWWLPASALAKVAWFGTGHLVVARGRPMVDGSDLQLVHEAPARAASEPRWQPGCMRRQVFGWSLRSANGVHKSF